MKIGKVEVFGYSLALLLGFIIAVYAERTQYVLAWGLLLLLIIEIFFVLKIDLSNILLLLIIWLPIQNFTLAYVYQHFNLPPLFTRSLIGSKEIVVFFLIVYLFMSKKIKNLNRIDKIAIGYFIIVTAYLLFPNRLSFEARIVSYRELIIPVILYSIGRFIKVTSVKLKQLVAVLLLMSVLIAIFGIFERFFPSTSFWVDSIDIVKYEHDVQGFKFVTSIRKTSIFGHYGIGDVRRLKSFFLHPNGLAYYTLFVIILMLAIYCDCSKKRPFSKMPYILLPLLITIQILSIGRAAIIGTLTGSVLLLLYFKRYGTSFLVAIIACVIPLSSRLVTQIIYSTLSLTESSTKSHYFALVKGWNALIFNPIGYGLGQGGLWASSYSDRPTMGIGENMYLAIAAQVGIIGSFLMIWFLLSIISFCLRNTKVCKTNLERYIVLSVPFSMIGYGIAALTTSPLLMFTTSGTYWIFVGIAVQIVHKYREKR